MVLTKLSIQENIERVQLLKVPFPRPLGHQMSHEDLKVDLATGIFWPHLYVPSD
jgi:hypothetical protein